MKEMLEPLSALQTTLPFASVVSLPELPKPEQAELLSVEIVRPPFERINPPAKVEVAVVDVAWK